MKKARKLLLWDIDGTLLTTGNAGVYALDCALKEFGIDTKIQDGDPDVSGRTDRYIARALLARHGRETSPENIHRFMEAYLTNLPDQLSKRQGRIHPGVKEILDRTREHPELVQGLLTGNLHKGAKLKLSHYDIFHYFEFGAFADDSEFRNELGPHAVARAREKHDIEFASDNIYVIGDTPHDIECGKVIGARTIAVATGAYSVEKLRACNPTAVFEDFRHPEKFFELIEK